MSNNGTESNSLKKHASSAKNGKRNSSRSNIKKREKKLAENFFNSPEESRSHSNC